MGLKLRLILAFSAVLAFVMAAGTAYFIRGAREDVGAEIQSTMQLTVHFLDGELARLVTARAGDTRELFKLDKLARVRHLRIEFFDWQGKLMDSNQRPESHPVRIPPGWFVGLASPAAASFSTVRRPVILDGQQVGELIISPDTSYEVSEIWQDTTELLQLALLLFVSVSLVMYWVVASALRPLERILAALTDMEGGNLQTRLPRFELPELSRLSDEFNRMADTLEHSMTQNRRLSRQLIDVQEDERKRLARELHDELGQCLSAIHADAVAILQHGEESYPPIRESARAIVDVTRRIMAGVRDMLHRLRPETLDALGLPEALRELTNAWSTRHPQVTCTLTLEGDLETLGDRADITLYRVVQEGLTNVARHAGARRVDISLGRCRGAGEERVRLSVRDDGVGVGRNQAVQGFGLLGMRERILSLEGTLVVDSRPGQGCALIAEFPLPVTEVA